MFPSRPLPAADPAPAPPLPHAASHATDGLDAVSPASIGAASSALNVTAGYGMTGGGDLTASRTLAVDTSVIATRALLAAVQNGLQPKGTAYAAERSVNVTLAGSQTVGGVVVPANKVVLLTAQSTASQDGLWVTAVGAWARPDNSASGAIINSGAHVYIESHGGTSDGYQYYLDGENLDLTVDLDSQVWKVYQLPTLPAPGAFSAVPYSPSGGGAYALSGTSSTPGLALGINDAANALEYRRYMPAERIFGVDHVPKDWGWAMVNEAYTATFRIHGQSAYVTNSILMKFEGTLSRYTLGSTDGDFGALDMWLVGGSFRVAASTGAAFPWMQVTAARFALTVPLKLPAFNSFALPVSPQIADVIYLADALFPSNDHTGGPVYQTGGGLRRFSDDLPYDSALGEGYLYPAGSSTDFLHVASTAYIRAEGYLNAGGGREWAGSVMLYYEDAMGSVVDIRVETVRGDFTLLGTPTASGTSGNKTITLPYDAAVTGALHIARV